MRGDAIPYIAMIKPAIAGILRRARYATVAAALLTALIGCNQTITSNPIVVYYSGSINVNFNWIGGVPDCVECAQTYVTVYTSEMGDFNYGPFTFSYDGVYLSQVLGGHNRIFTIWVTDNAGDTLYRGVLSDVHITSGVENPSVTVDIYGKGWYTLSVSQPSASWGLDKVRMSGDGSGWIAGSDNLGDHGVIFRGGNDIWALDSLQVSSSNYWALRSVVPSGDGAWAVGEDKQHGSGIILRNDGTIWHDDVTEPVVPGPWRLNGVDMIADIAGWAVGESESSTPESGVVLQYDQSGWTLYGPLNLPNCAFNDIAAISTAEFIIGGEDKSASTGFVLDWRMGNTITYTPAAMGDCTGEWAIKDVYAVEASDWWAAGSCDNGGGSTFGLAFHYTSASGEMLRQTISGITGNWTLEGIWADASGEAWAVGNTPTAAVILRLSGGEWSQVTPLMPPGDSLSWSLQSVDFPATGWGYAAGTDLTNNRGIILRYGFPK